MSTLERLRASDPARDLDPTPPEDLLRAIVATPRRPRQAPPRRARARPRDRRGGRRRSCSPPRGSTDLAARAYAQTAPADDSILYVRTTMRQRMEQDGRTERDETSRRERWQQGGRWRSVLHHQGEVYVEVRDADGVLHLPTARPPGARTAATPRTTSTAASQASWPTSARPTRAAGSTRAATPASPAAPRSATSSPNATTSRSTSSTPRPACRSARGSGWSPTPRRSAPAGDLRWASRSGSWRSPRPSRRSSSSHPRPRTSPSSRDRGS